MDLYFGKIKSKKFVPYQYRYNNYREYIEAQHNHIRYLETTIETLIQDIILLDNRLNAIRPTKEKSRIENINS
jgi:hypothetical protein